MTNKKCQQCVALCKQSDQVKIISCPNFRSSQKGNPYTEENATTVVLVPLLKKTWVTLPVKHKKDPYTGQNVKRRLYAETKTSTNNTNPR